jgi:hypothetical protein
MRRRAAAPTRTLGRSDRLHDGAVIIVGNVE